MTNPYKKQPPRAFWRSAVAEPGMWSIKGLWEPSFPLDKTSRIVTVGSCFAQHIGRALKEEGYNWADYDPAPRLLREPLKERFGYGHFSFRTGNIYTAALLRQWLSWSLGISQPPDEYWRSGERWIDPFRPQIEENAFASVEELIALRKQTMQGIRQAIEEADVWVVTLGLTEAWQNVRSNSWYPMCPGTAGGEFDPEQHRFHNFSYPEVMDDMRGVIEMIQAHNSAARFLLTISPVPLTATATERHVLVATEYSKSTLRAVADDLRKANPGLVDYFPSYEIITSPPFRGVLFEPNMRSVSRQGVDLVMHHFMTAIDAPTASATTRPAPTTAFRDPKCEEALLEAFRKPS